MFSMFGIHLLKGTEIWSEDLKGSVGFSFQPYCMLSVSVFKTTLTTFLSFSLFLIPSLRGVFWHLCTHLICVRHPQFLLISFPLHLFIHPLLCSLSSILWEQLFFPLLHVSLSSSWVSTILSLWDWTSFILTLTSTVFLLLSCFLSCLSASSTFPTSLCSGASLRVFCCMFFVGLNLCVSAACGCLSSPDRQAVWTARSWGSSTVPAAPVRLPHLGARRPSAPHHTHGRSPSLQPVGTAHNR